MERAETRLRMGPRIASQIPKRPEEKHVGYSSPRKAGMEAAESVPQRTVLPVRTVLGPAERERAILPEEDLRKRT